MRKIHFHGSWHVVQHKLKDISVIDDYDDFVKNFNQFSLEGSYVEFDKDGFCRWIPHPNSEKYPFMDARIFSINTKKGLWKLWMFTNNGIPISFDVSFHGEDIILAHKIGYCLQLQKVSDKISSDVGFTLLEALTNEEFSDLEIIAKNRKVFKCHQCILASVFPCQKFDSENNFLCGVSEDGVYAALYYAYSRCLPEDLIPDTANELLKAVHKMESTDAIVKEIKDFLAESDIKQVLEALTIDVGCCFEKIIKLLDGGKLLNVHDNAANFFANEPNRLVAIFKQIFEELCLASAKFLLWCEKFHLNRDKLRKRTRQDLCKRFVNMILGHIKTLDAEQDYLLAALESSSPDSIAALGEYVLPQVEQIFGIADVLQRTLKETIKRIVADMEESNAKLRDQQKGQSFLWKMKNKMLMKVLMTFTDINDDIMVFFDQVNEWSETMQSASTAEKAQYSAKKLKEYLNAVLQDKNILNIILTNGKRKKSLIFLHIVASLVAYVLEMVRRQRSSLGPVIQLFPKDVFRNVMKDLGLTVNQQQWDWKEESLGSNESFTQRSEVFEINENGTVGFEKNTALSTSLGNLLETSAFADLVFVVSDASSSHVDLNAEPKHRDQAVVFKAHRVVVATRCNWFRIALGSGMKESSERKFQIEGCDPEIFGLFLRYLYTGHIVDIEQLSVQQVASILTLADRYEVEDLLQLCERRLVASINDENVLFLVAVADSISAVALKTVALSHIKREKQKILSSDDFASLPEDLKNELQQIENNLPLL